MLFRSGESGAKADRKVSFKLISLLSIELLAEHMPMRGTQGRRQI
jgi:hypothetical protein